MQDIPEGGRTQWPGKAGSTGALAWAAPVSQATSHSHKFWKIT